MTGHVYKLHSAFVSDVVGTRHFSGRKGITIFLWKIEQNVNNDWDTYSDAVVVAKSAVKARNIHPSGNSFKDEIFEHTWTEPKNVTATKIGIADPSVKEGTVVCASFHAG